MKTTDINGEGVQDTSGSVATGPPEPRLYAIM